MSLRGRVRELARQVLTAHLSPGAVGLGVGVGVFIGCLPLYGLHLAICVAVAGLLRLNQPLVYLAANISNPLVAPLLIAAELAVGEWARYGRLPAAALPGGTVWQMARAGGDLFLSCLLGGLLVGTTLGGALGGLALVVARRRAVRTA